MVLKWPHTMRCAFGAALLVALLLAAPASARSPFHPVATGIVRADGERYWAALPDLPSQDPTQVFDDLTGQRWQIQPPRTADCYGLIGVAAGNALWQCSGGDPPLLQELESGAVRAVPGWEQFVTWLDLNQTGFIWGGGPRAFGDRWIELESGCYHCSTSLQYLDWHAGTFISTASDSPERTADLDRPNFDIPLCAPLRRLPTPENFVEAHPPFVDSQYERPWFLRWPHAPGTSVRLYHCGKHKPIPIARCKHSDCLDRRLGHGYVVWRDGRLVYWFDLHSRKRRLVGRMPAGTTVINYTSRRVYASGPGSSAGPIYAARLPRPKPYATR
jgi:hypothetical protein